MTTVRVTRVSIPAMSTIGTAYGIDVETGNEVHFAGDHRPMMEVGRAVQAARHEADLPVVEVEDWQLLGLKESS